MTKPIEYINITKNIKEKCKDGIFKAFVNAIYLHDLGKISVKYQLDVLNNNNKFTDMINDGMISNHSFYSAILYINEMCLEFKDNLFEDIYEIDCNELLIFLLRIIYNFSFEIYKHHSGLDDLNEFYKEKFYFTENDRNKSYTIKFFKELCLYNNDDILEDFIDTLFDVDNFKSINDTYGHLFGDEVLSKIATILNANLNGRGIAGRFGGDEFYIFTSNIKDTEDLRILLTTMRKELQYAFDSRIDEFGVTLSVGVSEYPKDGNNYEILFKKADKCLYLARKRKKPFYYL